MTRIFFTLLIAFIVLPSVAQTSTGDDEPTPIRFDRNHSTLGFIVPIVKGLSKVTGKFTDFSVDLIWQADDLDASSVQVEIQVESIETGIEGRNKHLKSDDFFDVAVYPTITFVSSKIRQNGEAYLVDGTLTMHGVVREVTLPLSTSTFTDADHTWTAFRVSSILDRTEYGMTWKHSSADFFVGDEIEIDIVLLTR